jgi:hypothetical protein
MKRLPRREDSGDAIGRIGPLSIQRRSGARGTSSLLILDSLGDEIIGNQRDPSQEQGFAGASNMELLVLIGEKHEPARPIQT